MPLPTSPPLLYLLLLPSPAACQSCCPRSTKDLFTYLCTICMIARQAGTAGAGQGEVSAALRLKSALGPRCAYAISVCVCLRVFLSFLCECFHKLSLLFSTARLRQGCAAGLTCCQEPLPLPATPSLTCLPACLAVSLHCSQGTDSKHKLISIREL